MNECTVRPMTLEEIEKYSKLTPPPRDIYEGAVKKSRRASYVSPLGNVEFETGYSKKQGHIDIIPSGLHGESIVIRRNE